jgi:hypothetical protein
MARAVVHLKHSLFMSEFLKTSQLVQVRDKDIADVIPENLRIDVRLRAMLSDEIRSEAHYAFLPRVTDWQRVLRHDNIRNEALSGC